MSELIKICFDFKDSFATGQSLVQANIPNCFTSSKDSPLSYWAWSLQSNNYFPKSGLEAHLDLGYLNGRILEKIETALEKNSFYSFETIKARRKTGRKLKAPAIVHQAEFTRESLQRWQHQNASSEGEWMIATQFVNGLLLPTRKSYRRIDEGLAQSFVGFLSKERNIRPIVRNHQLCYTLLQQTQILRELKAIYKERPSLHLTGFSPIASTHSVAGGKY
jgi:hypothetical protein